MMYSLPFRQATCSCIHVIITAFGSFLEVTIFAISLFVSVKKRKLMLILGLRLFAYLRKF